MIGALLALAGAVPLAAPLASLRLDLDGVTIAAVVRDGPKGPQLTMDCVERCRVPMHFADVAGDAPLGLFRLGDAEGRVVSIWASGSAYRVRVYDVRASGVRKVLDATTLGTPEFANGAGGATIVRITERGDRDPPSAVPRTVTWTWRNGRFIRR